MQDRGTTLEQFFEQIKTISLWKRIFGWAQLRSLSYEAYEEFRSLQEKIESASETVSDLKNELLIVKADNNHLNSDKLELAPLREKLSNAEKETSRLEKEVARLNQLEAGRITEQDKSMSTLASIRSQIELDRRNELDEVERKKNERLENIKSTWSQHQERVKETIKALCQKHTIEYFEKVPFRGAPDNTIMIADEYIIFDAKSPASDENLGNFPVYIKDQAERAKKYVKEENVKRDVFLVIPSNTVHVINDFTYNLADYNAYVVTLDSLEPIILSLKKLEDYEFAEQMSPEERDNISRVIGKFAHLTKRRVQIDQYFGKQSIELLLNSDTELPIDIFDKALEYENSGKLNPPADKRTKAISTPELQQGNTKIQKEAEMREIALPSEMQEIIESIPLRKNE